MWPCGQGNKHTQHTWGLWSCITRTCSQVRQLHTSKALMCNTVPKQELSCRRRQHLCDEIAARLRLAMFASEQHGHMDTLGACRSCRCKHANMQTMETRSTPRAVFVRSSTSTTSWCLWQRVCSPGRAWRLRNIRPWEGHSQTQDTGCKAEHKPHATCSHVHQKKHMFLQSAGCEFHEAPNDCSAVVMPWYDLYTAECSRAGQLVKCGTVNGSPVQRVKL